MAPILASVCRRGDELLATRGPCPPGYAEHGGAGANIFDAFWCMSPGQNTKGGNTADALAAMRSLKAAGIRHFRFFASLWGANQAFWLREPKRYWHPLDRVFDEAERLGLYTVPSIGAESWHEVANEVRFGNSSAPAGAWASNVDGEAGSGSDADAAAAGRPEYANELVHNPDSHAVRSCHACT